MVRGEVFRLRAQRGSRLAVVVQRNLDALVLAAAAVGAPAAAAHPMSASAILLDVGDDAVRGELQLLLDRLAVALDRPLTVAAARGRERASLERYVARHIGAAGAGGRPWSVRLGASTVRRLDRVAHLVLPLELRRPDGEVTAFRLRYDAIVEQLVTHKVLVTVRHDWDRGVVGGDVEPVGVLDFSTPALEVRAEGGSWLRGGVAVAGVGVEHIADGADHLLFLLMLLIPAPLVARGGRWAPAGSTWRSVRRVVHVVTAFAVGHSFALAAAALGWLAVPGRPVETLIALSILVSAIHAIRPLVPGGEAAIALGFGLAHGLAYASLIGDLGLDRGSLVSTLLAFNVGIEVTQLLVVLLTMPSLTVLSRTAVYPVFRTGVALVGAVLAVAWMLGRAAVTAADPFAAVTGRLVAHPFTVAAGVAVLAAVAQSAGAIGSRRASAPA